MTHLSDKTVAILATDGYEDSELTSPLEALEEHGATVVIVAPEMGTIIGKKGHEQQVTVNAASANADESDGLVLPGASKMAMRYG